MSLRQGTRPGSVPAWKLRRWLPVVLAATAGIGGPVTWAIAQPPAQPLPQMQPPVWQPVAAQPPTVVPASAELPAQPGAKKADPAPLKPFEDKKVEHAPPAKEKLITVNHEKADWTVVLDWYANESGLVPVYTVKPTGPVTIRGKAQTYTISEATDLLNEAMAPHKFILVRQTKTFTIIPVDDKVNWSTIPTITPDELEKKGRTELVVVTLQLKSLNVEDVAPELEKMLTPFGKLVAFRTSNSIQFGDQAGNMIRIKKLIDDLENRQDDTLNHQCKYKKAKEVAEVLKTLLTDPSTTVSNPTGGAPQYGGGYGGYGGYGDPRYDPRYDPRSDPRRRDDRNSSSGPTGRVKSVQISVEESTNTVYITAPPDKIALARNIIKDLDKPRSPDDRPIVITAPELKTYSVPVGTADIYAKTLQERNPSIRIVAVPSTNSIMVYGSKDEQDVIKAQLEGGATATTTETVIIPLQVLDPKTAAATAVTLFPAMGAPTISAQADGTLLVRGTPEQIKVVKDYLTKSGERVDGGGGPVGIGGPNFRTVNLEYGNGAMSAKVVQESMKKMGKNDVIIRDLTPGGGISAPSPNGPPPGPGGFNPPPMTNPNSNPIPNPGVVPSNTVPPVQKNSLPPMAPPTPLGGPQSQGTPQQRPAVRIGTQYASAQIVEQPQPNNGQKPVVITVIGNTLRVESEDAAAVDLVVQLIRYATRPPSAADENVFEVIRLKYVSAEDAAKVVTEVFNGPPPAQQGQSGGGLLGGLNPLGGLLGRFGGAGGSTPSNPTPNRIRVVAERSSNSLIVMKASPVDLMTIKELLKNVIDNGITEAVTQQTYVIPVKNVTAYDMSLVVKDVYKSATGSSAASGQIAPGGLGFLLGGRGGGGGGGAAASSTPPALTIGVDERTNSIIVKCSEPLYKDIYLLVQRLDETPSAAPEAPETVRIVQLKGLDPYLVQQTVDAMQGTDPNTRINQQNRMQGGGFGGGNQFGSGQFGGGSTRGGGSQFGGGLGGGGARPGGFGGGIQPSFGGGGTRGGGSTRGGGGRSGGGRQANLGTEGPSNFDDRGMDAPSAPISNLIYDPEEDRRSSVNLLNSAYNRVIQAGGQVPMGTGLPMGGPMQPGPLGFQPPPMTPPAPLAGTGGQSSDDPLVLVNPSGPITLYPLPSAPDILVIRAANERDMEQLLKLIALLQERLKDQQPDIRAIPLKYVDSNTMANTLNTIFSRVQVGAAGGSYIPPQARSTQAGVATALTGGPSATQNVYVFAQPRTNSLLIAAPQSRYPDIIKEIEKLDTPNKVQPRAFKLQKASAQIVGQQLQQLYSQRFPGEVAQNMEVRIGFDMSSNTVLVQAGGADMIDIEFLITFLDVNSSNALHEVKVFKLKNAYADELSQVLIQAVTANVVNPLTQATAPWYVFGQNTTGGAAGLGAFGGLGALAGGQGGFGGLGQGGQGGLGQGGQGQRLGQQGGLGGGFGGGGLGGAGGQINTSGQAPTVGTPSGFGFSTKSTTLQFYSAKEGKMVESGLLADVHIIPNVRLNSLLITAPKQTMDLLSRLIDDLDVVITARAYINVFELKKADAVLTAQMLQQLFTGTQRTALTPGGAGGGGALGGGAAGAAGATQGNRPLLTTGGEIAPGSSLIDLRITVDDRTNSLIVAGSQTDLDTIRSIIYRLEAADTPTRYNEVYKLRNAAAADVFTSLNTFLTNSLNVYTGAAFLSAYQQLQRNVVIVAEPVSNTLLISATPQYFGEIKRLIERIDAQPPQVVIQVLIAEVQLTNNQEVGVEFGLQSPVLFNRGVLSTDVGFNFNSTTPLPSAVNTSPGTVGFQGLGNLGVGRASSLGFGGFVFSAASDSFTLLIRAMQAQGRVEILSRPMIQVSDNQQGFVQVGQNFPTLGATTLAGTGTSQQSIEYQQIGITMRVTPRVNPDGKILMRVEPQISTPTAAPINLGNGVQAFAFNVQTVQTTVLASDGETVVLGGLISKTDTRTENGIPFMKDIPYVGALFRYRSQAINRREVLIIMTPHIVRSEFDNARVLAEEARRMHWCVPEAEKIHGHGMEVIGPAMKGANPVPVPPGGAPTSMAPGTYQPGPVYVSPSGNVVPTATQGAGVQYVPMQVLPPQPTMPVFVPVQPTGGVYMVPGPVPVGQMYPMQNLPAVPASATPVQPPAGVPVTVQQVGAPPMMPQYAILPQGAAAVPGMAPVVYTPMNQLAPAPTVPEPTAGNPRSYTMSSPLPQPTTSSHPNPKATEGRR